MASGEATTHPPREPFPVSGAWQPGHPAGHRQFLRIADDHPFALEGGGALSHITIAYETWGELDASMSNAVLVCHALTGDAHAAGPAGPGQPTAGWWDEMIGPGRPLDTDRLFVVCSNVLGGCQGSTGPASVNPDTEKPYGSTFPVVTVRDMVRAQARLADHLGVARWLTVIGGSMGGMQVIEWAVMFPQRVRSLISLASCAAASAWQVGWSSVGRRAIALDPKWRGGDYYDAEPGDGPHMGLALARSIAQITYRSDDVFEDRFGRDRIDPLGAFSLWDRFQTEGYLDYHGDKLVRRFDANSYLVLNKAMDLHDIARGRSSLAAAARRVMAPSLVVSVSSDSLYHPRQQRELNEALLSGGSASEYHVIESPHGHDGFLIEFDRMAPLVSDFVRKVEKSDG